MQELFQAAVEPVNIVFTVLLVFILLYWLSVIIGAIDLGALDFDLDFDADVDVDAEIDAHLSGASNVGWMAGALQFFNFGKLPFMVIMTFLIMSMWAISLLANHYLGDGTWLFALAILIPNLFISLVITKLVTTPLVPIFSKLDGSVEAVDYLGQECTVTLSTSTTKVGQAEVISDGSPLLISVKVAGGGKEQLKKGDKGVVVRQAESGNYYLIRHFK